MDPRGIDILHLLLRHIEVLNAELFRMQRAEFFDQSVESSELRTRLRTACQHVLDTLSDMDGRLEWRG